MKSLVLSALGISLFLATTCFSVADPLPGRDVLKFEQLPMIATPIQTTQLDGSVQDTIYYGHDELSTAVWDKTQSAEPLYAGVFMADDFADEFDSPVVHIRWWGSYMNLDASGGKTVDKFLIAFQSDIPANTEGANYEFSHPDCYHAPLSTQISTRDPDGTFMPMEGTFTETLVPGSNPLEPVYEYNAELLCPFEQEPNTVYWLSIVALVDQEPDSQFEPVMWGWHNRDYTQEDLLASRRPLVDPGEQQVGTLNAGTPDIADDDIPIWHFQDDAVSGTVENISILAPCQVHMDQDHDVHQNPSLVDEHYVDLLDGPDGISMYSKDLAFQLYTVPEPSTLALLFAGGLLLLIRRVLK